MSEENIPVPNCVSGFDVYASPEFQAFCRLIGVPWEKLTKDITIVLTEDSVTVTHKYLGDDSRQPVPADTTTLQNDVYRTQVPVTGEPLRCRSESKDSKVS